MIIRQLKQALAICALIAAPSMEGLLAAVEVPRLHNLQQSAQETQQGCRPLLLEFASEYCEYCSLLEDQILEPIQLNRDYDDRVVMRKILMGDAKRIIDYDGQSTHADELASRYQIFVTPTLVFVDRYGKEVAERMVGVTTLDFYGGYLDQALDNAKRHLKKQNDCKESSRFSNDV